jgi:hypothetical protein
MTSLYFIYGDETKIMHEVNEAVTQATVHVPITILTKQRKCLYLIMSDHYLMSGLITGAMTIF